MKTKMMRFLRCAGKAVLPKVPKWIAKAMGLDLVADMVEVGGNFCQHWLADVTEAEARLELQAVAHPLPLPQLKQAVQEVVGELAPDQPAEVKRGLTQYLMQIPDVTRQALRTPADPSGTTVPATMSLKKVADVINLLPCGLAQFQAGERPACLHGDWELVEMLGRGGQGEVWKACRIDDADFVSAFKFWTDPDVKRQLQIAHEKEVVQRVKKANLKGVVTLEDYKLDSSPPWLRYELIEGGDLAGLVNEWNEQPAIARTDFALGIVQRLAKTVGQFHRLSEPVIHRDLKPANILVRRTGGDKPVWQFLIADFGIGHIAARRQLDQAKIPTIAPKSLGTLRFACTPLYASPQQQRGDDPDPRDDVYALGVIWYQLCLRDLAKGAPTGLGWEKKLRGLGLGEDHIMLLGECMAEDPDDRPKDAQDLQDRLAALATAPKAVAPVVAEPIAPKPAVKPASESPVERVRRLKTQAARLHDDARALIELHDYAAAAELFEGFRPELIPLRDAALFADTIAKRDRLRQLHQEIHERLDSGNLKDPRLPGLIAAFVEIKPNDADMLDLAREFPAPKRGQVITAAVGMKFAWVPPGSSWLGGGGGKPGTTPFTVEHGFWCGIHPVTQADWQQVMGGNPSHFKGNPRYPVESVSWNDVQSFLQKLNSRGGGYSYRLPTEQEWEYICRGGPINQEQSKDHYYFAKSKSDLTPNPTDDLTNKANFGSHLQKPSDVGSYFPNPLGIYDMHGNVWEWTSSLWEAGGSDRVIRGGSWLNDAVLCTASDRSWFEPDYSYYYLGFRLLAVPQVH